MLYFNKNNVQQCLTINNVQLLLFIIYMNIIYIFKVKTFVNLSEQFDFYISVLLYKNIPNCDLDGKNTIQEMEIETTLSLQESKIGKVLTCFSVYANTKIIFNMKLHADTLPIIHGLKFLNMCWLIIGHTALYMTDYIGK